MNSQNPLDRFPQWFRPKSRRVMVLLVVVMLAIFLLQFLSQPIPQTMCSLIDDCEIKSNERHRIVFALGAAGLNDFEIKDQQVMVPKRERGKYLKALADQNVLPAALASTAEETTEVNLFMPRSQQQMMANSQKKQRIRKMIMRLPFVSEAWLEIDNASNGTAFRSPIQTAVVMVQPTKHYSLDRQQIETIKGLIGGAIANMKPENIVVTDINVGVAYDNLDDRRQNDLLKLVGYKSERHRFYQSRIERALVSLEGVKVDVQIDYLQKVLGDSLAATAQNQPRPHLMDHNSVRKLKKPVATDSNVQATAYESAVTSGLPVNLKLPEDFEPGNFKPRNVEPTTNAAQASDFAGANSMFGGANGVATVEEESGSHSVENSFAPAETTAPRYELPIGTSDFGSSDFGTSDTDTSDFQPPATLPKSPTTPPATLPSTQFEVPEKVAQLPSFQTVEPTGPSPAQMPNTIPNSISNRNSNSIPNFTASPTEFVSVVVRVPQETIERVMVNSGVSRSEQTHLLKAEIINLVKPILPATSFGSVFPITILLPHEPPVASLSLGDKKVMQALQTYWPLAAVLMISMMALAYTRRKTPAAASSPQLNMSQLQESDSDELRNQLTRLIDNDPETAAKVIKSWIRQS